METVLAMLVSIEEESSVTFYLPEEKREIQLPLSDDLVGEFKEALTGDESYFVTLDLNLQQVV